MCHALINAKNRRKPKPSVNAQNIRESSLKTPREMFIVDPMLLRISEAVYRRIREYGGLSKTQVAKKIERHPQAVWRWESKNVIPDREQEDALVELAGVTNDTFVELMCEVLTDFGTRRVVVDPESFFLPSPLVRASKLYDHYQGKLGQEARDRIVDKLSSARQQDASTVRFLNDTEREVRRLVEEALAARGESLDDD